MNGRLNKRSRVNRRGFHCAVMTISLLLIVACGADDDADDEAAAGDTENGESDAADEDDTNNGDASDDALIERANDEGEVTWYVAPYGLETAEDIVDLFESEYPEISVNLFRATTGETYQRFSQEHEAGIAEADVIALTGVPLMDDLKARDAFAQYEPPNAANLLEQHRDQDPDGFYHIFNAAHVVITYNPEIVDEADVPKSWEDLLDDRWDGEIAMGHPAASGYKANWAVAMFREYGEEYFEALSRNNLLIGQSILDTTPRITQGERSIGVNGSDLVAPDVLGDDPIEMIYPDDGAVEVASSVAVTAEAPNPNAARLFMDFLFSESRFELTRDEWYIAPLIDGVDQPDYAPDDFATMPVEPEGYDEDRETVIDLWEEYMGV